MPSLWLRSGASPSSCPASGPVSLELHQSPECVLLCCLPFVGVTQPAVSPAWRRVGARSVHVCVGSQTVGGSSFHVLGGSACWLSDSWWGWSGRRPRGDSAQAERLQRSSTLLCAGEGHLSASRGEDGLTHPGGFPSWGAERVGLKPRTGAVTARGPCVYLDSEKQSLLPPQGPGQVCVGAAGQVCFVPWQLLPPACGWRDTLTAVGGQLPFDTNSDQEAALLFRSAKASSHPDVVRLVDHVPSDA